MARLLQLINSDRLFYSFVGLFVLGAAWTAAASLFPMAFDEEFHYGLIKIYASSLLPFGIEHTGDMAQYGAATADASYLFHYLMSFPYRLLDAVGLPDMAIIIVLRFINVAFVAAGLVIFRRAFIHAGVSRSVSTIGLILVSTVPVFVLLAAHINYDNLLFLIIGWCVLLAVRLTNHVRQAKPLPLSETLQLVAAVLIGMSVKYAFLPLALGLFLWIVWLVIVAYRAHKQTISSQLTAFKSEWLAVAPRRKYAWIGLLTISLFFASHYLTNTLSYGSPIPSCERVFSETECQAYGPWNRNKNYEANKSESFVPLSYGAYMTTEWLPGMTQRLTFAVAGKTNGFQTKLPMPALVYMYVILAIVGATCLLIQIVRRKTPSLAAFTLLLTLIYVGTLSFQLYGDYIDTAQPVAINGRYLIPLLPLVAVVFIQAIRGVLSSVSSYRLALVTIGIAGLLVISGAGAGTYIVQAESHWFWPGVGQESHQALKSIVEPIVLPYRY